MRERFYTKVKIIPGGCHLWMAATDDQGYGKFAVEGKVKLAHRVAYEMNVGPIPDGSELDHVRARGCTSTSCVNPDHLEPVTHAENVRRGENGKKWREKTHCPKGHPYSGHNLYVSPQGYRFCRECGNERGRKYRAGLKPSVVAPDLEIR